MPIKTLFKPKPFKIDTEPFIFAARKLELCLNGSGLLSVFLFVAFREQ